MRIWLRDIRKIKGYSQYEAAKLCGISRSYYADIEREYRSPAPDIAKDIGGVLGFDWTIFFAQSRRETRTKSKTTA